MKKEFDIKAELSKIYGFIGVLTIFFFGKLLSDEVKINLPQVFWILVILLSVLMFYNAWRIRTQK